MMVHRKMLALTEGARARIALTVALGLAISGTFVAQGVAVALVVGRVLAGEPWTEALAPVGAVALLAALRALLLRWREMSSMLTAAEVKVALRQRLYRALLALGPGYLERTRTGTVQSTLVDGVEALEAYLGYYLPQSIVAVAVPDAGILRLRHRRADPWVCGRPEAPPSTMADEQRPPPVAPSMAPRVCMRRWQLWRRARNAADQIGERRDVYGRDVAGQLAGEHR